MASRCATKQEVIDLLNCIINQDCELAEKNKLIIYQIKYYEIELVFLSYFICLYLENNSSVNIVEKILKLLNEYYLRVQWFDINYIEALYSRFGDKDLCMDDKLIQTQERINNHDYY